MDAVSLFLFPVRPKLVPALDVPEIDAGGGGGGNVGGGGKLTNGGGPLGGGLNDG